MIYTPEEQINRTKWDEVAPIHLRSYGLDQLRRRQSMLREIERRELDDLTGKSILHLQCHIGHDTLSLALEGGHVTKAKDYPRPPIENNIISRADYLPCYNCFVMDYQ